MSVLTSFKKYVWHFLAITEEKPLSISFRIAGRGGVPFVSAKELGESDVCLTVHH